MLSLELLKECVPISYQNVFFQYTYTLWKHTHTDTQRHSYTHTHIHENVKTSIKLTKMKSNSRKTAHHSLIMSCKMVLPLQ